MPLGHAVCPECQREFSRYYGRNYPPPKFCSRRCRALTHAREQPMHMRFKSSERIIPLADRLQRRLIEGPPTVETGEAIRLETQARESGRGMWGTCPGGAR